MVKSAISYVNTLHRNKFEIAVHASWQKYIFLEFPSETTTRSGYNIIRRNFAVATMKRQVLFMGVGR
jgi:hypothetical protein